MLTIEDHINYWLETAEKDLKVAEGLFNLGHYDWCLFMGHLVLEKALKAVYILKKQDQSPPKIHNLLKLTQLSNLELSSDQMQFLQIVNDFHLEARYPEYKKELFDTATEHFTKTNLQLIKELFQWLKSKIK